MKPNLAKLYACSPGNPTGKVMDLAQWRVLFELSDRHGFVVAADECYSEIYLDETKPPLGALAAAQELGRENCSRLIVFSILSKRFNVPGMRTGFVAGDAELIRAFLRHRTYHGSAMGLPVQASSVAAWGDETHVAENRRPMENTACTAQSSSNAWMPGPASRPASASCSGAIRRIRARNCRRYWRSKLLASGLSG